MQSIHLVVAAVLLATGSWAAAGEGPDTPASLVIVHDADLPDDVLQGLTNRISEALHIQVSACEVANPDRCERAIVLADADIGGEEKKRDRPVFVRVVDGADDGGDEWVAPCTNAANVARCEVASLRNLDEAGSDIWGGALPVRLEKDVLFKAARLLEIPTCPFPLCVMYVSDNLHDLDLKSRNLCPPCQEHWRQTSRGANQ